MTQFPDINTNAVTFTQPESYIKKNYLNPDQVEKRKLFEEQILINLRTYDMTSLVLYANDHLNNFVHIFLDNGTQVVYLFNHGNVIHNVTVEYPNLNTSTSVQIAITRTLENTTVHVNERTATIPVGVLLLDEYSNKPWNNSERGNRTHIWVCV